MLLTNISFSFIICLTREPKARCSLAAGKIVCYVPAAKGFAGRIFPKLSVQSVFRRDHRVADALEGIKSSLSEISVSLDGLGKDLDGCISVSGKGRFLCITGNISTY